MIGDITQQNLYLIIPSKVSRIADILTTQRCGMKVRWIFTMIS